MWHLQTFLPWRFSQLTNPKVAKTYYAADGSPINNLGAQDVNAIDENGQTIRLQFDICNITKPLASVYTIANKGNEVVFRDDGGYIKNVATGKQTPLRLEGKLYYLDLWLEVPENLVMASPFLRPQRQP